MIKTIYLDMDGVLSDFTAGWHNALGVPFDIYDYPLPKGLWDYSSVIEKQYGIKWGAIVKVCSRRIFWYQLPMIRDAHRFYRSLCERHNVVFLTHATGVFNECLIGKQLWLDGFTDFNSYEMILLKSDEAKGIYATPDSVLIDDKDDNIQDFIRSGGRGILVPRPWNNRRFEFESFEQANRLVEKNLEVVENE